MRRGKLLYGNFGTAYGFASKAANLAGLVSDYAITVSVDGVVAANACTNAGALGCANLANDNLTGLNFLTTVDLNAETLTGTVAGIFGCTTCFNV